MREGLVELGAENEELAGRWLVDVFWTDVSGDSDLLDGLDDAGSVVDVVLVVGQVAEILESWSFTVVGSDESCKDC